MSKRVRPEVYYAGWALALTVAGVAALFAAFRLPWTWYHLLGAWLLAVNLVTLAFYGHDKARARVGGRRVPEAVLHGLALAGGTPGAYLGMSLFRHKTIKPAFRLLFRLIAVLQVLLAAAAVYRVWKNHH
jgi:uncharacterized membrane protein YsdA (DUF1294 family)